MARFERTLNIEHEIGETGRFRIRTLDGHVRLRAVDGGTARVLVTYRIRAADEESADRAVEASEVRVDRGPDRLEIDTIDRRWFDVLGQLLAGNRVRVDYDVEVPRRASVQVDGVSADVLAEGLAGDQKFHTVSGALQLEEAAGSIAADSVSGRIRAFGTAAIELRTHTVSGQIQAAAARLDHVRAATTSGGVDLAGTLAPGVEHRVQTVSGGVRVATDDGVTVELQTVSGGLHSSRPGSTEHLDGRRRMVVGDGRAILRVQSMSGGVEVSALGASGGSAAAPEAESPTSTPVDPDPRGESSAGSGEPPTTADNSIELAILRALERGEIGVEEAAAKLAAASERREGSAATAGGERGFSEVGAGTGPA